MRCIAASGHSIVCCNMAASHTSVTTDADVLARHNRLIRSDEEDRSNDSWEVRYARRAYESLDRGALLLDFSRMFDGAMVGCRWRTPQESESGKGDTECAGVSCNARSGL